MASQDRILVDLVAAFKPVWEGDLSAISTADWAAACKVLQVSEYVEHV